MEKILITGAHGFIGRHLSKHLNSLGYKVTGIGHGFWTEREWKSWGLTEWYEMDIALASLVAHGNKPFAIFHCAGSGSVGFSVENPMQDFERTVISTINVLEYIRTLSPASILIYPSSAAVYGISERQPIAETEKSLPTSPYGHHKKIAEDLCLSYGKSYGLSIGIVRLFSVYGIELRKQLLWDSCLKSINGSTEFFGTGSETRDWINVKDVVRLMHKLVSVADQNVRIINGGTGSSVRTSEVISYLFTRLNNSEDIIFNGKIRNGDPQHYLADISSATSIGWKPEISWKDGIDEYVDWFASLK